MAYQSVIGGLFIWLSYVCLGCAKEPKDIVAKVGDQTITVSQVQEYIENLPEEARSDKSELDESREHLLTMIDMELMLLEARTQGIDKDPSYLKKVNKSKRQKLVGVYLQRRLELALEESDVLAFIEQKGYERALRLADIMVPDQQTAATLIKELNAGKDFAQLAKKWSINDKTAPQGGDMGKFTSRDQMIPALQDAIFALAVGEVSDPIQLGERYAFFKVLAEGKIKLKPQQRMKIYHEFERMQFNIAKAAHVDSLKKAYNLKIEQDNFEILIENLLRRAAFTTAEERNTPLYSYDQGTITAGDFVDVASDFKGNVLAKLTDSQQAVSFAERHLLPDQLLMSAALRAGIDKEAKMEKWLANQERQLLAMTLRETLLEAKVNIGENEVRQYYEAHPEKYLHPEHFEIEEILVATEAEAAALKKQIENGTPLGELADKHSIRSKELAGEKGRFHVHAYEVLQFGGLVEAVTAAEIGTLNGPVAVKEGYSIFRILSKGRKPETFEEAGWRAKSHLKREKNRQAFNQFIEDLRLRYDSEITLLEENLQTAFGTE